LLGKGILVVGETSGIGFGVAQAVRMALSCLDAAIFGVALVVGAVMSSAFRADNWIRWP
jgi:hypothetical protein